MKKETLKQYAWLFCENLFIYFIYKYTYLYICIFIYFIFVTWTQVLPCWKGHRCNQKANERHMIGSWEKKKKETGSSLCFHKWKHPFREPELSTAEQRTQQAKKSSILDMQNHPTQNVMNSCSLNSDERTKDQWKWRSLSVQWTWGLWISSSIAQSAGTTVTRCWWLCLVKSEVLCTFQHRPRCPIFLQQASRSSTWAVMWSQPKLPFCLLPCIATALSELWDWDSSRKHRGGVADSRCYG